MADRPSYKEQELEARRFKAKAKRYKKAIVSGFNIDDIRQELYEIEEDAADVRWFEGTNNELLEQLIGDEDEAYEFKTAFFMLANDAQRMMEGLDQYAYGEIASVFDDLFGATQSGGCDMYMGYDAFEEDYMPLESFEHQFAAEECQNRLMRLTKKELIENIGICIGIFRNFIGIRSRHEDLRASIDILRNGNSGLLKAIKRVDELYGAAEKARFSPFEEATKEYDKALEELPQEAWLQ